MKSKRTKYRNRKAGGFDSQKERRVFDQLSAMQAASDARFRVVKLDRQVPFELIPAQYDEKTGRQIERPIFYVADFVVEFADGRREVIDAKSEFTRKLPVYVIKRKLMLFRHGLRIVEQ